MSDIETSAETRPAADDPSQEPARKRQRLSHYPSMVDVVDEPKGDLVMKVGQHEEDFGLVRVHKVILMMASPVLRETLSKLEPDRKYDETDPLAMNEDRTAFIDFCMMIHHQSKDKQAIPLGRTAGLAVIFHKFKCMNMLKQNISWQLREFFGPTLDQVYVADLKGSGLRLEDVLCISYVSGDEKLFYRCSRFMITRLTADRTMRHLKTNQALLILMPEKLLDHMQVLRSYHLDRLENEIYEPISHLHDAADDNEDFCPLAKDKVMRYIMGLCRMKGGMSRLSDGLVAMSMVWSDLAALAKSIAAIEKGACSDCDNVCNTPMAEPLARAAVRAAEEVGGLCLYCVKEDKSPLERCKHKLLV